MGDTSHPTTGGLVHRGRILALVGAALAVFGLWLKFLVMDNVDNLAPLSKAVPSVPDGVPTIFGALDTWAQPLVGVLLAVVVVLAVWPPLGHPQDRVSAGITSLSGVAFFVYAFVKVQEALDDAEALNALGDTVDAAAADGLYELGMANAGFGFWLIMLGTAMVAIGGVVGLRARRRISTSPQFPAPRHT